MKLLIKEAKKIKLRPYLFVALLYFALFIISFTIGTIFSYFIFKQILFIDHFISIFSASIYFLVILFIYSFFKLGMINLVTKEKITPFKKLGGFFLLNTLIITFGFIAVSIIGTIILYSLNDAIIAGAIFLIIFAIVYYPFLLFAQFEFIKKGKIFRSFIIAWKTLWSKKLLKYIILLTGNAIVFGVYLLIFALIGLLYDLAFIKNNSSPAVFINIYNIFFLILTIILYIAILSYNIFYIKNIKE